MSKDYLQTIEQLKGQQKAIILAHNYQPPGVQDLADFCGDSLELSRKAADTDAELIVFCGVEFMAETAAILSPEKTVVLPDKHAGCPMADMITAQQLKDLKKQHPGAVVVCYVNSSAEVKAQSDYCCTSANALEVVKSLPQDKPVIFVPDQHLGRFVAEQTGRELILWPGYCPCHVVITEQHIKKAKAGHPGALVLAHPECSEQVKDAADHILSTSQMLRLTRTCDADEFIIATEVGMIYPLQKENPEKTFIPASESALCRNMKKITIDKIIRSMQELEYKISLPKPVITNAKKSLDRMVEILPTR